MSEVRTPAGAIVQQAQPQQTGTLAGIATADKPEIAVAVVIKRPVTARIPEDFEP